MNKLYTIHVDDKIFVLTKDTINTHDGNLLKKAINYNGGIFYDKYVMIHGDDIYVDRDPKSFSYVIDHLRNYQFNVDDITDEYFKRKVIDDLDYFGLYCNFGSIGNFDDDVNDIAEEDIKSNTDNLNKLMDIISNGTINTDLIQQVSNNLDVIESIKKQRESECVEDSPVGSLDLSDSDDELSEYESV